MDLNEIKNEFVLEILQQEHQKLDDQIDNFSLNPQISAIELQRLKKKKLLLKDQITFAKSRIHENIIA